VAIFPDGVILADVEGAVVLSAAMLEEVVGLAVEQERLEGWIMEEVKSGPALPAIYPANEQNKARCEAGKRLGQL
jgi:regulator of RNase E activity RraA